MTKEQIARLAKEAGFTDADENSVWITDGFWTLELERFFHAAYAAGAAAEREACAKVIEKYCGAWNDEGFALASAVRARSNT